MQLGVAPDAELESLKLATTDGSTDVSQVIAALDWVTQHPFTADGTPIRVVNLAYGTDSVQPYQADPLAAAVENAWHHGIVVVVSGGNEGPSANRLTDPAMDPYVLAVGASDGKDSSPAGPIRTSRRSAAPATPPATSTWSRRDAHSSHCATRVPTSTATSRKARCRATLAPALPRQRYQPGRGGHVGRSRAAAAGLPEPHARPGQVRAHPVRDPGHEQHRR